MKETTPLVSVLMPVYNGMPYLPMAAESILNQTFTDFEFIIVNDCSTDGSNKYLHSLHDVRIVLVELQQNLGVTGALQEGMKRVRGKYVARLDADDMAKPHRLQTQVDYLERNSEVGLLGSSVELIDASSKFLKHVNLAKDDIEIRWKFLFKNPFFHSTVMFRYALVNKHHLGYFRKHGEDYQLWVELMQFCEGAISKDELIQYRTHQQSWTFTKNSNQVHAADEIASNEILKYISIKNDKIPLLISFARGNKLEKTIRNEIENLFIKLVEAFLLKNKRNVTLKITLQLLRELKKMNGFVVIFSSWPIITMRFILHRVWRPQS